MRVSAASADKIVETVLDELSVFDKAAEVIGADADNDSPPLQAFSHAAAMDTLAFRAAVEDQRRLFEAMVRRAAAEVIEEIKSERGANDPRMAQSVIKICPATIGDEVE